MSTPTLHRPEHVEEQLDTLQVEKAKEAGTVGEFQQGFKQEAMLVMAQADPETARLVQSRIDVVSEATKDQMHVAIAATDANVLGHARVGGGDAGIVLSEQYFGEITTMDDAVQMRHAGKHEQRHGEQAGLSGGVVFNGESIDALLLYEGDAELAANVQMAMAETEHREGQPEEVYAEGQTVAYAIRQAVGKEIWNTVLTETGDAQALQEALDRAGQGRAETDVTPGNPPVGRSIPAEPQTPDPQPAGALGA